MSINLVPTTFNIGGTLWIATATPTFTGSCDSTVLHNPSAVSFTGTGSTGLTSQTCCHKQLHDRRDVVAPDSTPGARYTTTAHQQNGSEPSPPRGVSFKVDTTSPANVLTLTNPSGGASSLIGTTVSYDGSVAGSFTITNALTDTGGSGPASSTFASLGGTTTGWTFTSSVVNTPAGGPYVSNTFSWAAGTTSSPTELVTGTDKVGNPNAGTTLTFANTTNKLVIAQGQCLGHLRATPISG